MSHSLKNYAGFLAGLYMATVPLSVAGAPIEKLAPRDDFSKAGASVTSILPYFKTTQVVLLEKSVNTLWPRTVRINPFLHENFLGRITLRVIETKNLGSGHVISTVVEIEDTHRNSMRFEIKEPDARQSGYTSVLSKNSNGFHSLHMLSDGKMSVFVNGKVSKDTHDGRPDFFRDAVGFSKALIQEAYVQNQTDNDRKVLLVKDISAAGDEQFPAGPVMRRHFEGPVKIKVELVHDKTDSTEVLYYALTIKDENGNAVYAERRPGDETRKGFLSITEKNSQGSTNFVSMNGLLKIRISPHDESAAFVEYKGDNRQFNDLRRMANFYFDKALDVGVPRPEGRGITHPHRGVHL